MQKTLIGIIVCLTCALAISLLFNFGVVELPKKATEKTLELSNIEIIMYDDEWNKSPTVITSVAFEVKNISQNPERLWIYNISLFDYKNNRYDANSDYEVNKYKYSESHGRLSSFEDINPNVRKKFYLTFEVPKDELYSIGIAPNIKILGDSKFINEYRNINCWYRTFRDMLSKREELNIGKTSK
ncbi:MAG: hypothetical protein SNH07_09235 [Rikenellaceae bacterium]